jgi:hypothetical protein
MTEMKIGVRGDIYLTSFQNINNLIVDFGLNNLCSLSGDSGAAAGVADDMGVGDWNGAPAAGQTTLGSEQDRAAGTYTKQGTGAFDISASFTGNTFTATEVGLFDNPTSGSENYMLGRATYSPETLSSGDTLNVVYTVSFAAV